MTPDWIPYFALTLGIEGAAAFAIGPLVGMKGWRAASAAILGSAATHPIVWYSALALYPLWGVALTVLLVEAFAAGAETVFYRVLTRSDWSRCALVSISVNALSWGLGVLLQLS